MKEITQVELVKMLDEAKCNDDSLSLSGVKFMGVFNNLDLGRVSFNNFDFQGIVLNDILFNSSSLSNGTFRDAILSNVVFDRAVIKYVGFRGAIINGLDFNKAVLQDAHFDGAICNRINFHGAVINRCGFFSSQLQNVNFREATTIHNDFTNCENIVTFSFGKDVALFQKDVYILKISTICKYLFEWVNQYQIILKTEPFNYTNEQIEQYGRMIKLLAS